MSRIRCHLQTWMESLARLRGSDWICRAAGPRAVLRRPGLMVALLGAMMPLAALGEVEAIRLAVAPFEGESREAPVSARLAELFAEGAAERLLPPGSFVAEPGLSASAEAIRAWAYNAAVDDVLLGRVESPDAADETRLEVSLRSGHSWAERLRRALTLAPSQGGQGGGATRDAQLRALVADVRRILSGDPVADAGLPKPSARPGPAPTPKKPSERGLEAGLDLPGFRSDAPIEINAEEAEIVSRNRGRELVFRRNVEVKQANVTLRSDLLEATYLKGQSEPEQLVAQGHVLVDQGGRRARCDRAIYRRAARRLTCAGRAELVQGCDVVRGDSIEFDLADDRARVEGAASIVIRPGDGEGQSCIDAEGLL
jgi:lipopolysaccharide transport protein LptA